MTIPWRNVLCRLSCTYRLNTIELQQSHGLLFFNHPEKTTNQSPAPGTAEHIQTEINQAID